LGILSALALLLVVSATGCGGVHATVPVSPMMFMQNPAPPPAPAGLAAPTIAANDAAAPGQ